MPLTYEQENDILDAQSTDGFESHIIAVLSEFEKGSTISTHQLAIGLLVRVGIADPSDRIVADVVEALERHSELYV